ncbi:MAG: putative DNA binding domain-containing protein [Thiotrichales bacterium]|nr:putative DNA binding domain-containing protein [Thiotrichales bacterium]
MLSVPEVRNLLARLDGEPADALESETLEFKPWSTARDAYKSQVRTLREAAVAIANARGGIVVLGVADRKKTRAEAIQGVGDLDSEGLRRDIYDGTDPHILVDIEAIKEPEGRVLAIRIPRGLGVHTTTDGVARLRVGKESKPLTGSVLAQTLLGRGGLDLTAEVLPEARRSDLDPEQFGRLRRVIEVEGGARELTALPDDDLLRALDLISDSGITRAAILLMGTSSALARMVPNNEVIFTRHAVTKTRYDARRDLRSPLLRQLDQCEALLEAHTGLTTVPVDGFRDLEVPDVGRWTAREAILNAVCHRDWFVNQSVLVSLHPDRLEIESPGGFVGGVNAENVMRHPPVRRNPLLANVLQTIGLVNRAGLGVDRLHEESLRAGKRPPRYEADSAYVRLILPTRTDPAFAAFVAGERESGAELALDDLLLLEALTRNPDIDRWTAAACLRIAESAAAERLVSLRERGYLTSLGRGRGTKYRFATRLGRLRAQPVPDGPTAEAAVRERILELLAERGAVTNRDVRRLTGLSRREALGLLRNMSDEGLLRMTGHRRGARYLAGPRLQ